MELIFITLLSLSLPFTDFDPPVKCDLNKVEAVAKNLDELSLEMVDALFETLDSTCTNNVEFIEWSNEVLFDVLAQEPKLFVQALTRTTKAKQLLILSELEGPVQERDLKQLSARFVQEVPESPLRKNVLSALTVANQKGQN